MIKKVKNMQAFDSVGVSLDAYLDWCKENGIPYNKSESKRKFFDGLRDGTLIIEESKIVTKGE